jgi:hypothetical protein
MAIFSERKDRSPIEPEMCARCRARPGTSWLDFLVSGESDPPAAGARRAWLCNPCREAIQHNAGGN